jgi:hypothetical protein
MMVKLPPIGRNRGSVVQQYNSEQLADKLSKKRHDSPVEKNITSLERSLMKQNNELAMLELIDGGLVSADASIDLASNIKRALVKQNRHNNLPNRSFEIQTRINVTNLGPIKAPNAKLPFELCKLPTAKVRKNVYYRNIV